MQFLIYIYFFIFIYISNIRTPHNTLTNNSIKQVHAQSRNSHTTVQVVYMKVTDSFLNASYTIVSLQIYCCFFRKCLLHSHQQLFD